MEGRAQRILYPGLSEFIQKMVRSRAVETQSLTFWGMPGEADQCTEVEN